MRNFFYPKSVAVIGVSETPGNLGKLVIKNLATFGFGGRWHAVGQKPGMVLDRSIYRSVLDIPDEVDMAAILTPAKFVPGTVRACAEKGIKRLTISTAGFSEYREEGAALEKEILEVCEKNDIRFIGPNCLAVINMENGLCLPFSPQDRKLWEKGPVGVISQSGTMAIHYSKHLGYGKVGVGKVASIGNKLNVDEVDLLEYFIEDPSTKLVVLYLESFSRPGKFLELAASCKKPIILHKSNTSSMSRSIARSHTKAVTGNDAVTEFSLKEAGVIRVRDISEMMNCVKAALLPPLTGKRLAVVSGGGGTAIIGADDAYRNGFDLPPLPGSFLEWLRSKGRAGIISLTNPIDVGDIYDSEVYSQVIERLLSLAEIDGVFFDFSYAMEWAKEFPRADCFVYFDELYRTSEKPVVLRASTDHPAALAEFDAAISVPYFDSMSGAFSALRKVKEAREGIPLPPSVVTWPEDSGNIEKIICKAKSNGKTFLDYEGYEILQSLGIPMAPYSYIPRERATSSVELNFGYPVALKALGESLMHKTDAGAVRLGLKDPDTLANELSSMLRDARLAGATGFLVQEMIEGGVEMIVGAKRDEQFGPVVVVGMGGVLVELFADVISAPAPVSMEMAERMVNALKGRALLGGYRGALEADVPSLLKIINKVADLMVAFPSIEEIDLNPVKVSAKGRGSVVVDCKIFL